MDDLCSACLCAGRKLYLINGSGVENLYSQIINEIPVYNILELHIRICWECKALLRRFGEFKEQVKRCYTEILAFVQQNTLKPFSNYPRIQIHQVHTDSYPTIKEEVLESPIDDDHQADDEIHRDDDYVKEEEHCEPETFVKDLSVAKVKKKKLKKVNKLIKEKSKKKLKIKKEDKKLPDLNPHHVNSTVENLIDSTINNCYNKQDCEEEKMEKVEIEIKITRAVEKAKVKPPKEVLSDKPTCGECGKSFSSRKTYRYHLNVLHKGQNRYPCPRCGKVYQWKSNLGRHMRSHKARDSDELYCELCDKRFASVATFRQHLKISRRHVSESEFSFMCNECGKKFVNKTRLRDHIDWEHLKKIKFKCQLCNKPFKCHTSLYVHMQNVHRSKDKKDNLCHVCGKSYQNAAKLKYHIVAMHTSETPYQCAQCSAAFGWYSSLYRHVREVHYKMKVQPKKGKKIKKPEVLPPLLPVIPQQIILPQIHQPGPA